MKLVSTILAVLLTSGIALANVTSQPPKESTPSKGRTSATKTVTCPTLEQLLAEKAEQESNDRIERAKVRREAFIGIFK